MRTHYGFGDLLFSVAMTLMLFVTAALLLPSRAEDETQGLRAYFEANGRYALLSLSSFLLFAFGLNVFYLEQPYEAVWAVLDLPMIALPATLSNCP